MLLFSYLRIFDLYELQTYDWRFRLRGPQPVSQDIVFVDIWNDTLEVLGAWPFERKYHAALIQTLDEAGAKAVAFDIIFTESHPDDPLVTKFARKAGNVYFVFAFDKPYRSEGGHRADRIIDPLLESYTQSAKAVGFVNSKADLDGKRRRAIPYIDYQGRRHYQLSIRLAMDYLGVKEEEVRVRPRRKIFLSKDFRIPLDEEGYLIVNYAGPWESTFKHYSYLDVIAAYQETLAGKKPRLDLNELKGKICFVGLTSLGSHDVNPIPIQNVYPMVGSYANILNSILLKSFTLRVDRLWNLALLLLLGIWIAGVALRRRLLQAALICIATLAGYLGLTVFLFVKMGLWLDLFYPLAAGIVVYAVTTLTRAMREIRKRELIENELKIASQIQQSFLPQSLPEQKGVDLAVYMKPAKAVGGDLYAFVSLGDGRQGVMVGDVSGKGTPAALFMARAVSEFKFSARDKNEPFQALTALNDSIAAESTGGLFVTVAYLILDAASGKCVLSNGGHLPPVLVRSQGQGSFVTSEEGMPIGVLPGVPFSDYEFQIEKGDCIAFYTDGISEARNAKGQEYGADMLLRKIQENVRLSAQGILNAVIQDMRRFIGKADPHDDMTLILVKRQEDILSEVKES